MACSTQERSFNGRVQVLGVGYAPLLAPGGASTPILSCALLFLQNLGACYISELVEQSVQVMTDCYVKCCQRLQNAQLQFFSSTLAARLQAPQ